LPARLDDPNQLDAFQQIEVYAHAIPAASWQGWRSVMQENDRLICPTGKAIMRPSFPGWREESIFMVGIMDSPMCNCTSKLARFTRAPE
jgi:hypothetical protein